MADNIFGSTALTSQDFDGGWHTFGALAEVSEDANLVGGRAFFPNPAPANFLWVVFRVSDEAIIAEVDLTSLPSPTLADWNDFDSSAFDVPGDVALDPAEQYIPAVVTNGDFRFLDAGVTYPYGAGIATGAEGRFFNGGSGPVFPVSSSSGVVFGADMLVEVAGGGGDATATPVVVACTSNVAAPTVRTGSTISASIVSAAAALPAPTTSVGSTATPSTAAAVAAIGVPTAATGSTVAPSTASASATVPAPAPRTGSTVSPASVAATASVAVVQLSTGSTASAAVVAAVSSVPAPAVSTGTDATISASVVAAVAQIGTPTLSAGVTLTQATIAALAAMPAPVVSSNPAGVILRPDSGSAFRPDSGKILRP